MNVWYAGTKKLLLEEFIVITFLKYVRSAQKDLARLRTRDKTVLKRRYYINYYRNLQKHALPCFQGTVSLATISCSIIFRIIFSPLATKN